jgi:acetyl-CoA carboxylase biotin carboxyl carrier protein
MAAPKRPEAFSGFENFRSTRWFVFLLICWVAMTLDEIRELIQLVTDTAIAELEVQRGENRVRIRRSMELTVDPTFTVPAAPVRAAESASRNERPAAAPAHAAEASVDTSLVYVKSPIVGTFYEASAPGTPAFVRIGETVQPGKVLCIIESMKLMNEIESEISGVVEAMLVENGQPVEYGEALFAIRPL